MKTDTLHVVTGKGGVGKTTVACALAVAEARRGRRVLLSEINGGGATARALGVAPSGYEMREVMDNLTLIDLTPKESLREYVLLIIRIEALYRAVFESRMVSSFLGLLPALGELTMLGKLWYEATLTRDGRARFDVIVIDAPATGHARALLLAPSQVAHSIPTGPMRDNAERIDAMLTDNARTSVHVVATPEPMPIQEANELYDFIAQQKLRWGLLVLNQVLPPLSEHAQGALRDLAQPNPSAACARALDALRRRHMRQQSGSDAQHKLVVPQATRATVPAIAAERPSVEHLADIGARLLAQHERLHPPHGAPARSSERTRKSEVRA